MKIKLFAAMLLLANLSGCVVAVVAGAASSLVVYDKRSLSVVEKDARIFHVIRKAIIPDPRFHDSRIVVSSFNQVVLLVGQSPTTSLRALAYECAKKTPNVRRVYNQITIDYPLSLSQQSQDAWETSQVRTNMLAQRGLESGSIRVITENNVVYLMGIMTPEQADLAVLAARSVKGVRKVVKVFQYIR